MADGGEGNDRFLWMWGDGSDLVDGGGDTDLFEVLLSASDDTVELLADGPSASALRGLGAMPFWLTMMNVETLHVETGSGNDTLTIRGLSFPGLRSVRVDLGPGDDTLIGAPPDLPPGMPQPTRIFVDGGPGFDEFLGGPVRAC